MRRGRARRHPTWPWLAGAAVILGAACEPPAPAALGDAPGASVRSAAPPGMPAPREEASSAPQPEPSGPPKPAALEGSGPFVELPVEGHAAAVVSLPLGATGPRPVVIAAHGNFDRPEWQCDVWRKIAGNNCFILCPRGVARRDSPGPDDIRFTYPTNEALEKEIRAGLAALKARFPEHVDPGPILYTGFSLGAIMGVSIALRDPGLFPRVVLVEGGHDKWSPGAAAAFAKGGGQRVLFACGQPGCTAAAKPRAAHLEKVNVLAKVVHGKNVGHSYDGAVADEVRAALGWVVEGDPRFSGAPVETKR